LDIDNPFIAMSGTDIIDLIRTVLFSADKTFKTKDMVHDKQLVITTEKLDKNVKRDE
jgi:hypothetical protein